MILGIIGGVQRAELVFALLLGEEPFYCVVGREHRAGGSQLGAHVGDDVAVHRGQRVQPGAVILNDAPDATVDVVAAQHLENHVLGAAPLGELAAQLDAPHLGHVHVVGLAGHRHGDVEAARADRQHPHRARGRRVRVRAEQRRARDPESLLMDGVGNPVTGGRVPDAPLLARTLQEQVVVGVLVILLDEVVVDVLGRELGFEALDLHGFELEHDHRTGGVLGQRLVDLECDLLARLHSAVDEVVLDELLGYCSRHR